MEPEVNLPGSPFGPSASGGPCSPFRAQPEAPRLGILHLMVWTACTAAYLAWVKTLTQLNAGSAGELGTIALLLHGSQGIVAGAALAGLLLWAARCWRRLPFPVHPGEYLLVVLGMTVVMHTFLYAAWLFIIGGWQLIITEESPSGFARSMMFLFAIPMLGSGLVCLWPAVRLKSPGWRVYFALAAAANVLVGCCAFFPTSGGDWSGVLTLLVLPVVVVRDHVAGRRYPWTHWAGVAAQVWAVVTQLLWLAAIILVPGWL